MNHDDIDPFALIDYLQKGRSIQVLQISHPDPIRLSVRRCFLPALRKGSRGCPKTGTAYPASHANTFPAN
jgi:hypothetical protein